MFVLRVLMMCMSMMCAFFLCGVMCAFMMRVYDVCVHNVWVLMCVLCVFMMCYFCVFMMCVLIMSLHGVCIHDVCVPDVCVLCAYEVCVVCVFPPETAEPPKISIYGEKKVGQSVTVQCSVVHTCPTFPPILKLNIGSEWSKVATELLLDGTARTTLTVSLHIQSDQQRVGCSVRHHGGLEAAASGSVEAECKLAYTFYIKAI